MRLLRDAIGVFWDTEGLPFDDALSETGLA